MQTMNDCPLCTSEKIEKLQEHVFKFPGGNVHGHLLDATYVRLWILFERIAKTHDPIVFYSCLCRECGLIFTNPRFSTEDLTIKYETIVELGSVKCRLLHNPASNLDSRAKRIYKLVQQYYCSESLPKPRILDYGGASGYNLIPFVDTLECGILDYEKWDLPKGISYLGKDISDLDEGDQFDVILLLHTLEHVLKPKLFLEELCNSVNDQGVIYVEVPLGCFREWQFLNEPLTHINFFSEESLYKCFQYCGLHIIHLSTSYQWVTHGKMWCLNIIGSKTCHNHSSLPTPLPTGKQMNRIVYCLPYLFNKRALRKVFRKFTGI